MRTKTKIEKIIKLLTVELAASLPEFISEEYVKFMTDSTLENSGIPFVTVINQVGKPVDMLDTSAVIQFLRSDDIQNQLKEKPKTPKVKVEKKIIFDLPDVSKDKISEQIYNVIRSVFPSDKFVLKYGLTIRLQDVLSNFRNAMDNQELRKKDLSSFLINSGLFYRTPQGLFTYCNRIPFADMGIDSAPLFNLEDTSEEQ